MSDDAKPLTKVVADAVLIQKFKTWDNAVSHAECVAMAEALDEARARVAAWEKEFAPYVRPDEAAFQSVDLEAYRSAIKHLTLASRRAEKAEAERDAANARVAQLEAALREVRFTLDQIAIRLGTSDIAAEWAHALRVKVNAALSGQPPPDGGK